MDKANVQDFVIIMLKDEVACSSCRTPPRQQGIAARDVASVDTLNRRRPVAA